MFRLNQSLSGAFLVVAVVSGLSTALVGQNKSSPASESSAISVIRDPNASEFEKAKACQRLAVVGDKDAVPALASLLPDDRLSGYARTALERIPDRAADEALRAALNATQGRLLAGVVHSIGKRRDPLAVDRLGELLAHSDSTVSVAAAQALGEIGNDEAAARLRSRLQSSPKRVRAGIGDALLRCAQRATQKGDRNRAAELCEFLCAADLPEHIRQSATYYLILAQGKRGLQTLPPQLDSADEATFRMALQLARKLGADAATILAQRMQQMTPDRQSLALIALADLGDRRTLPAIRAAARSADESVCVEAIRGLGNLHDDQSIDLLFELATQRGGRVTESARQTLAAVNADDFEPRTVEALEKRIIQALDETDPSVVRVAMLLAADRNLAAATGKLLELSETVSENELRLAALGASGRTVSTREFGDLIERVTSARTQEEADAGSGALRTACLRLAQDEAADQMAAAMKGAPVATRIMLLEQMPILGGRRALAIVAESSRDEDERIVDASTRVLGQWLTADAARPALELSRSLVNDKYRLRTLRGSIRIARQLDMDLEERTAICRDALSIADRDDERLLILEVLSRYPSADGLSIAVSLIDQPTIREQCCNAVLEIAGSLEDASEDVERALTKVIESTRREATAQQATRMLQQMKRPSR